jgi:3-dehydroquinate synthase
MILKGLEEFREHLGGQLSLTMLRGIGAGVEVHEIILPKMLSALAELPQHQSQKNLFRLPKTAL